MFFELLRSFLFFGTSLHGKSYSNISTQDVFTNKYFVITACVNKLFNNVFKRRTYEREKNKFIITNLLT